MRLAEVFKQSSIYLMGDLARRGVGFLMIPIYTHFLSTSDYGTIELIELFVMVAGVCFGLTALSEGMIRIYHDHSDEDWHAKVVSTGVITAAVLGLVIVIVATFLAPYLSISVFGNAQYTKLIRTAFAAMLLSNITDIILIYHRIRLRPVFFVIFSLAQLIANVAGNVYFIAFAKMGVWGFVLAKLLVMGAGAVFLLAGFYREIPFRFALGAAKRLLSFAGPLVPTGAGFFVIHFADRFFVNHYASLSDVGIYGLAYKIGFLVTYLVGQPFGSVWNVSLYAQTGSAQWRQHFARVATYFGFSLVLVASGLGIFINKVIGIMASPAYASAATLVPVIAFGYAFREMGDFFRGVLFINKRVAIFGRVTLSAAALNLALNWALIPRYKAAGAAWATLLTWLVYMGGCWFLAHREHQVPYRVKSFALMISLGAVACAVVRQTTFLPLAAQWLVSGMLVLALIGAGWVLGYFDVSERRMIRKQIAGSWESLFAAGERFR